MKVIMENSLKIYRWAWVAVVAATLLAIGVMAICTSHHELAEDPNNLEKIVKVDMPGIAHSESENNLSRGASRWDMYVHHGCFTEDLPEATVKTLEELCVTEFPAQFIMTDSHLFMK